MTKDQVTKIANIAMKDFLMGNINRTECIDIIISATEKRLRKYYKKK